MRCNYSFNSCINCSRLLLLSHWCTDKIEVFHNFMESRTVKLPKPRTNTSRLLMPVDACMLGMPGPRTVLEECIGTTGTCGDGIGVDIFLT